MRTLKEWFDDLQTPAKSYILSRCEWIDIDQPDYYKRYTNDKPLNEFMKSIEGKSRSAYGLFFTAYLLKNEIDEHPEDKKYTEALYKMVLSHCDYDEDLIFWLDLEAVRKFYKERYERRNYYNISYCLLMTDDFDNIDWSKLDTGCINYTTELSNIIGNAKWKELLLEKPSRMSLVNMNINDDLFDELFFGKNGWSETQKLEIIRQYRPDQTSIDDFLKRIVSVEKKYLRYLKNIVSNYPAITSYLYTDKKGESDKAASPNMNEFRYSKELRKLFMIAGCCARGTLPKSKAGTIGDIASLIKFYNFDFGMIFDSLYPELMESTVNTEVC